MPAAKSGAGTDGARFDLLVGRNTLQKALAAASKQAQALQKQLAQVGVGGRGGSRRDALVRSFS